MIPLLLASQSAIRLTLLQNAGLDVHAYPARVDEPALRSALLAENASPRDIADALAEAKALKLAQRHPQALVLGCDQVLALGARLFSKPNSMAEARQQLRDHPSTAVSRGCLPPGPARLAACRCRPSDHAAPFRGLS